MMLCEQQIGNHDLTVYLSEIMLDDLSVWRDRWGRGGEVDQGDYIIARFNRIALQALPGC